MVSCMHAAFKNAASHTVCVGKSVLTHHFRSPVPNGLWTGTGPRTGVWHPCFKVDQTRMSELQTEMLFNANANVTFI